jgi:hypothetical protein
LAESMNDLPDELPETEFMDRLRQRGVIAKRSQLRHLKRKGEIRGAVQRRVPGRRGSVSMYLASEVDRVVALLSAQFEGRKTVERASRTAWLQLGEAALVPGMTSRSYILDVINEKRAALAADPRGAELLDLLRNPVDFDADEDGTLSEKGFSFVEELLTAKQHSPELPLMELAAHAMIIKDYAAETELAEVHSVAELLGPISTPEGNREAWGESMFRLPASQILLNPREYLDDVTDETIERARQVGAVFIQSLRAFVDLPRRLERLHQPSGANAQSLATLGRLFSGPLASDPVIVVAYLAKQLSLDPVSPQFLKSLDIITRGLADTARTERIVEADPSLLKKLEEIAAARRNKDT